MAAIQTTMMSASITAYSTAVGPSSAFRKFTTAFFSFNICPSLVIGNTETHPRRLRQPGALSVCRHPLRNCCSCSGPRRIVQRHVLERVAGVGAQCGNRCDTDDDDQGEHD